MTLFFTIGTVQFTRDYSYDSLASPARTMPSGKMLKAVGCSQGTTRSPLF